MGLTSRAGVVPLNLLADIAGPMARTVADAVAVFQVVAGEDPDDPVTARSRGQPCRRLRRVARARRPARARASACCARPTSADARIRKCVRVFNARARRSATRRARRSSIPVTVAGARPMRRRRRGGLVQPVQVRPQRIARASRATARRCRRWRRSSRRGAFIRRSRPRLEAAQAESLPPARNPGCQQPRRVPRRVARRRSTTHDGLAAARRARLSDVEQPAAADRRPEHAGRRQQPGLLADARAFRRSPCRWATRAATRCRRGMTFFGRAWSEPTLITARVRVRAGDAPSASAGECAAAAVERHPRRVHHAAPPGWRVAYSALRSASISAAARMPRST